MKEWIKKASKNECKRNDCLHFNMLYFGNCDIVVESMLNCLEKIKDYYEYKYKKMNSQKLVDNINKEKK